MNTNIKNYLVGLLACIFLLLNACKSVLHTPETMELTGLEVPAEKLSLKTRADLAMQQEFEATKDPLTGKVPREKLMLAYNEIKARESGRLEKAAISGIVWTERGPSNVGGRTRTFLFDKNDATGKTVFAASVSGGLWKTENIYANPVEWVALGDQFTNMAITAIAQDPVHPDTMYFGTGEAYYNIDAVRGDGMWRSLDGGATWTQLSATTGSDFDYVTKIVIDTSHNILVGTRSASCNYGGVFRSTDLGATFTKRSTGAVSCASIADIEKASATTYYAAMGIFYSDGIYKSTDGGVSWSSVYTAASDEERIELACVNGYPNLVYALVQKDDNTVKKMMKSHNGGSTWITLSNISWQDQCSGGYSSDFTRGQAWYDFVAAVDPTDTATLVVGGIDLFKTTNGGTSWTQISSWVGCGGFNEVHADQHWILFKEGSADTALFGNDGGIYLCKNFSSGSPVISSKESSYNTTQFYACALHPTYNTNTFLAGAQDNGSQKFSSAGVSITSEVTGGDGGFCHIDQDDANYVITAYTRNQYARSSDGGNSFTNVIFSSSVGKFINPSDYDNDAYIVYAAYGTGSFLRWSNPRSGSSATTISAGFSGQVSAVTCDPNTANRVYFGTDAGKVYLVNSANGTPSVTDITGGSMPASTVSCIAVQDGNASHLLATFSNYSVVSVWESTNGGTSWTSVEGNLPDMPVRWAMFSPKGSDSALLATELGVFSTTNLNGGSTDWASSNTGLANVRVNMLQNRASDSLIIAATHGRGLYSTKFFSNRIIPQFDANKTSVYVAEPITFYDDSYGATSWQWDFDNDGIYDATEQNPTFAYGEGGIKSIKLRINGSNSYTLTKSSYISVRPSLAVPYAVGDGGNFESNSFHFGSSAITGTNLWERGSPSNTLTTLNSSSNGWKTDLDANCPDETTECHLYSPSFNMTASGTYTLSFRKSMEQYFSNAPYAVIVEYSTDGGQNWSKLGTSPDANGTNWYANTGIDGSIESDGIGFLENATNESTSYNVSSLSGNSDVRFRFTYRSNSGFSTIGFKDGFMIDDFALSGPTNNSKPLAGIETTTASRTLNVGTSDSVNFYSSQGKLIATVVNQSGSHNFGSTVIEIDNAGGGTSNFDTNTVAARKIFSKTIKITPTTNNASVNVKITMYFTEAELTAWKSATGRFAKNIQLFKTTGAVGSSTMANGVYPSSTVIDSTYLGNQLCVTGYFSNGFSGVGAGGGNGGGQGPLPVRWLSFTGNREMDFNRLNWTTAEEINNSHFEIWRKINDEDFTYVDELAGRGTTTRPQSYEWLDHHNSAVSAGTVCYRLKQIDFDGKSEFSRVVCLTQDQRNIPIQISPNPVTEKLLVTMSERKTEGVDLEVVDMLGQVAMQFSEIKSGDELDVHALSPGAYIAILRIGQQVVGEQKFVKQ